MSQKFSGNTQKSPKAISEIVKTQSREVSFKSVRRRLENDESSKNVKEILNLTEVDVKKNIHHNRITKGARISLAHLQQLIKEKTSSREFKNNPAIRIKRSKVKKTFTSINPFHKNSPGSLTNSLSDCLKESIKKLDDSEKLPLTSGQVLKRFAKDLTNFEKAEILDYDYIYYMGNGIAKLNMESRTGYDDNHNDYNTYVGEHINYRYEILDILGKGSFGQALKCIDHKNQQLVAVKIIKSKKRLYNQAMIEIQILKYINDHDSEKKANVVRILDHFVFRNHVVILQ